MRILIIDDQPATRELLRELLCPHFQVFTAGGGEAGLRQARRERPDLVLLDLGRPDRDGLSVCEALRADEATRRIHVVMVGLQADLETRVRAFELGADDCVPLPFLARELIARLRARARRMREARLDARFDPPAEAVRCGNLELAPERLEARVDGRAVRLSVLEFNLMALFVRNRERILSRERILATVWGDAPVTDRTVDAHVAILRRKLSGMDHRLATIYGAGYVLRPTGA